MPWRRIAFRVILEALGRRGGKDHQLRAAHDHVERIAELVRDPGRERADHVQPLGVPELRDGERALALLGGDEVPETIEQHGDEQEDREAPSLVPKHHRGVQSLLVRDDRDEHPGCERGDREGIPDAPTAEPGAERHGEHVGKREADIDARGPVPRRRRHEERGADYDSVLADDSLRLPGSDDRSGSARSQLHLDSVRMRPERRRRWLLFRDGSSLRQSRRETMRPRSARKARTFGALALSRVKSA